MQLTGTATHHLPLTHSGPTVQYHLRAFSRFLSHRLQSFSEPMRLKVHLQPHKESYSSQYATEAVLSFGCRMSISPSGQSAVNIIIKRVGGINTMYSLHCPFFSSFRPAGERLRIYLLQFTVRQHPQLLSCSLSSLLILKSSGEALDCGWRTTTRSRSMCAQNTMPYLIKRSFYNMCQRHGVHFQSILCSSSSKTSASTCYALSLHGPLSIVFYKYSTSTLTAFIYITKLHADLDTGDIVVRMLGYIGFTRSGFTAQQYVLHGLIETNAIDWAKEN